MCRSCADRQADVLTLEHCPCREAVVNRALDRVRQRVAAELGEVPAGAAALTWVTDFPMFEWCARARSPVCHLLAMTRLRASYLFPSPSKCSKFSSVAWSVYIPGRAHVSMQAPPASMAAFEARNAGKADQQARALQMRSSGIDGL